jgi:hypothetical protein
VEKNKQVFRRCETPNISRGSPNPPQYPIKLCVRQHQCLLAM